MSNNEDNIDQEMLADIDQEQEIKRKRARYLRQLLDDAKGRDGRTVAIRSEMGVTLSGSGVPVTVPSYLVVHSLRQLGNRAEMKMGSDMPFMQQYIDPEDGKLIVDESNAAELLQRQPDWTRQVALAAYLVHEDSRKFGTILAVINPSWIDDPNHENWGPDGRAIVSAIDYEPLDSAGSIGLLNLKEMDRFALDGQHRIMGIRGLVELMDAPLPHRKKDGTPKSSAITREEFFTELKSDATSLSKLLDETVPVEYIPAVVKGETRSEATRRIRSIFVSINSYAKKVDKGEAYLLNESDGNAIAARKVGLRHPLFKNEKGGDRVNWKNTGLPSGAKTLTTLQALVDIVQIVNVNNHNGDRAERWKPRFRGMVPLRPSESEIDHAVEEVELVLDGIMRLPSMQAILNSGSDLDTWREFPDPADPSDVRKGHLLLRPIGQEVVVDAVTQLVSQYGVSIDEVFRKLTLLDAAGGFEQLNPNNVWLNVTVEKGKMVMNKRDLAARLLIYLVRGAEPEEQDELLATVRDLRMNTEKDRWLNFNGEWVALDDAASRLPNKIG